MDGWICWYSFGHTFLSKCQTVHCVWLWWKQTENLSPSEWSQLNKVVSLCLVLWSLHTTAATGKVSDIVRLFHCSTFVKDSMFLKISSQSMRVFHSLSLRVWEKLCHIREVLGRTLDDLWSTRCQRFKAFQSEKSLSKVFTYIKMS